MTYRLCLLSIMTGGLLGLLSCSSEEPTFTLKNNLDLARSNAPIELSRQDISQKAGNIPDNQSPILVNTQGDTLPSQLDDTDNDHRWDEVAFLTDIPAQSSIKVHLKFVASENYPAFKKRTNIRFGVKDDNGITNQKNLSIPRDELPAPAFSRFQMDGPAWENNKVGFRHYIDGRNARDLYGKLSPKMALDTVGISPDSELVDNYHTMEYWGRDILSVGNSLGIGGIAIMDKGKPVRLGIKMDDPQSNIDTTKYQLITQGPVRSIFELTYKGWHVGNRSIDVKHRVSIWADRYRYGNSVRLENISPEDSLVVGLVNSNNDKPLMVINDAAQDWIGIATHDKQTYDKKWNLGLGLILPKQQYLTYQEAPENGPGITTSYNTLLTLNNNQPLSYFVLAGWEMSKRDFANRSYFKQFAQEEIEKIQHPVSIQ